MAKFCQRFLAEELTSIDEYKQGAYEASLEKVFHRMVSEWHRGNGHRSYIFIISSAMHDCRRLASLATARAVVGWWVLWRPLQPVGAAAPTRFVVGTKS